MLFVMFTSSEANEVNCFKKLTFEEACKLTSNLEEQYKEKRKVAKVNFHLLNDQDEELYTGTLHLGSGYAQNIYHHIYKKLSAHKFSKQQEEKKQELFREMEKETPLHLRSLPSEQVTVSQPNQSPLSKLTSVQRKLIYGVGIGAFVISLSLNIIYLSDMKTYKTAVASVSDKLETQEKVTNIYQDALSGNPDDAIDQFSKMKKLSASDKKVYINLLLSEKKYEEAVKVSQGDVSNIETMLFKEGNVETLKEFNKAFPSENADFDIAYLEKRWADVVGVKGMTMNEKRHEMRSYAFLKNGKLKEAKSEAAKANSSELDNKIARFEKIQKELDNTKKQLADENKKDSKDDEKIKSLTENQKKQEEEIKSI